MALLLCPKHIKDRLWEKEFVVSFKDSSQAPFKTEMQSENSASQRETSLLNMEKKQVKLNEKFRVNVMWRSELITITPLKGLYCSLQI